MPGATESFAKVILILGHLDVVSVVTVTRILKRVAVVGIKLPTILLIRLPGAEAFFVTRIDCASQQVRPILIHVVVLAIAIVTIVTSTVINVPEALES